MSEQRWLSLARSDDFTERLFRFTEPFSKSENRRPLERRAIRTEGAATSPGVGVAGILSCRCPVL
jgi:hypothetical protein